MARGEGGGWIAFTGDKSHTQAICNLEIKKEIKATLRRAELVESVPIALRK